MPDFSPNSLHQTRGRTAADKVYTRGSIRTSNSPSSNSTAASASASASASPSRSSKAPAGQPSAHRASSQAGGSFSAPSAVAAAAAATANAMFNAASGAGQAPRASSSSGSGRGGGSSKATGLSEEGENTGRWTLEEHKIFLEGLKLHGKGWKQIAMMIQSRTVVQIRTHAQKYFQKLSKAQQNGTLHGEGVTMDTRGGPAVSMAPARDLAMAKEKAGGRGGAGGAGGDGGGSKEKRGKGGRKKNVGKRKVSEVDDGASASRKHQGNSKTMKITLKKGAKDKGTLKAPSPNSVALSTSPYDTGLFLDESGHHAWHGDGVSIGGVDDVDALLGVDGGLGVVDETGTDQGFAWFDHHDDNAGAFSSNFEDATRSIDSASSNGSDNENSNSGSDYGSNSGGSDSESQHAQLNAVPKDAMGSNYDANAAAPSGVMGYHGASAARHPCLPPGVEPEAMVAARYPQTRMPVYAMTHNSGSNQIMHDHLPANNKAFMDGDFTQNQYHYSQHQYILQQQQQQQRRFSAIQGVEECPFPHLEQAESHQPPAVAGVKGYAMLQHVMPSQMPYSHSPPLPYQHQNQHQYYNVGSMVGAVDNRNCRLQQYPYGLPSMGRPRQAHAVEQEPNVVDAQQQAPLPPPQQQQQQQQPHQNHQNHQNHIVAKSGGGGDATALGELLEPTDFDTNFDDEGAFVSALLLPDGGSTEVF